MPSAYKKWPIQFEQNARSILFLADQTAKGFEYLITQARQHKRLLCSAIIDGIPPDIITIQKLTYEILDTIFERGGPRPMWYRNSEQIFVIACQFVPPVEIEIEQQFAEITNRYLTRNKPTGKQSPTIENIRLAIQQEQWETTIEATKNALSDMNKIKRLILAISFERKGSNGGNGGSTPKGYLVQGWPVSIKRTM